MAQGKKRGPLPIVSDPDPAYQAEYTDLDPDPIRIEGFNNKKIEKFTAEKSDIFLSKIANYLSLGLQKGLPSYRRSLQPSKEKIQHFET